VPPETRDEPLSANRDFKVLLSSQGVSSLGDAVSFTALPLLVLALTGSGFAMGIVGALQTLPDLVFGIVAGALADRSDRKRMMLLADVGRAALTALIPISVALNGDDGSDSDRGGTDERAAGILPRRLHLLRSGTGWTQPGRPRQLLFRDHLLDGLHRGTGPAGVLASTIRPGPTLAIDAVSFALSGLGLTLVRRQLVAPVDRPREPLLTEIRQGIDFIARHPTLRSAILFWGATSIVTAPLVTALAVRVTRDLGYQPSILGVLLTAFGVGTVIGALLTSRRTTRRHVGLVLLAGNFATAMSLMIVAATDQVPILLGAALVAGIAQSAVLVTYMTLRTSHSPDALLGRVGSTARTISLGLQPIGLLVGGALIDLTDGSTTIALMGLAVATVSLLFLPVRALRHASLASR
jgi:ENTS family enterobactin (siderophore) exporter